MGFFSKLFGNNEPEQPAVIQQPVAVEAPAPKPLNLKAADVVASLGGQENILEMKPCAFTRVRVQLKAPVPGIGDTLQGTGVSAVMAVNDQVVHLLVGLQADRACDALNAELAG